MKELEVFSLSQLRGISRDIFDLKGGVSISVRAKSRLRDTITQT